MVTFTLGVIMTDLINLCGLWKRTDKNNDEYFVGKLTYTTRLFIFKNKHGKSESAPDYYICLAKNEDLSGTGEPSTDLSKEDDVF